MAAERGEKPEVGENQQLGTTTTTRKKTTRVIVVVVVLRVIAFLATAAATFVMAFNKQTKTIVVATIGNTQINATLTAKFQHTPAFVYFIIVNGMASLHSLLMLAVEFVGYKFDFIKGVRLVMVAILDVLTVALVSGGATAAAFMGELGRNGNSHAKWNKICDKFPTFCDHGAGAIAVSFAGLLLILIITSISIINLHRETRNQ